MKMTLGKIGEIAGQGDKIPAGMENMEVDKLLTDSRSFLAPEGTMFFAIPTRTNAGTHYMRALYDKGVRMFVAPEIPAEMSGCDDAAVLIDSDPVGLMQKIAARKNKSDGGEVVGITGSRGKTTIKEWLYQLLEPMHEIARSPRSYNSQIGVPLSMWEITPSTDLTLIEAGISRAGEMERLEKCIHPDTVIIADMGPEHDEGFSSYAEKVAEKVSLSRNAGKVIYCYDCQDVRKELEALEKDKELIGWSMETPDAELFVRSVSFDTHRPGESPKGTQAEIAYVWKGEEGSILVNAKNVGDVHNALYALCYMLSSGYAPAVVGRRFKSIRPIETRMSVSEGGAGCSILYDSYPSDLVSLSPAIDFMVRRKMPGQKSVVVLSDIQHSSDSSEAGCRRLAALLRQRGIDLFIGVGAEFGRHAGLFGENSMFFPDTYSLASRLREKPLTRSIVLLKGSREYDFTELKEVLEARTHETLLEVNLDSILKNYRYFKSRLPASTGLVAMVKASAYGAGSYEIAKTLQDAGAAYLAVAVLDEGIDLRRQGISMPIMVMNPRVADYREMFANKLEPEIYTPGMLEDVIEAAERCGVKEYPIHVKLDTGMHRMGFIEAELPGLMERIGGQDSVIISSVFSHLATADEPGMDDYTEFQLTAFARCSDYMLSRSARPFLRHILNSAGILRYADRYHYDMARLGIGLYGVNTLPAEMEDRLAVVSSLKTVIINLRDWEAGTTVGYGRRGVLGKASRIATIPIGYADGMNRKFGNGAIRVRINGREAPTIGNICMDACMIDVTGIECSIGDEVEIFGENMPVERLAEVIGTIPYEILTSVSPRVKRVYFRE